MFESEKNERSPVFFFFVSVRKFSNVALSHITKAWTPRTEMDAPPQTFGWNQDYAVNIAALDRQHQSLFATVNELNEALAAGHGADVTQSVLEKLIEYAETHFLVEEFLMEQHEFPELYQHKVEHKKFTDQVLRFMARFRSRDSGVPGALMCFMENWLTQHVLTTDKAYSCHLNERGVH